MEVSSKVVTEVFVGEETVFGGDVAEGNDGTDEVPCGIGTSDAVSTEEMLARVAEGVREATGEDADVDEWWGRLVEDIVGTALLNPLLVTVVFEGFVGLEVPKDGETSPVLAVEGKTEVVVENRSNEFELGVIASVPEVSDIDELKDVLSVDRTVKANSVIVAKVGLYLKPTPP